MSEELPAADPGNPFLAPGPSALTSALVDVNGKQMLMLTVRTASTTCTVLLGSKGEADTWIKVIQESRDKMTDLVLPPKVGPFLIPDTNGRRH